MPTPAAAPRTTRATALAATPAATPAAAPAPAWPGVYTTTVVDLRDPQGLGRVKVALPWLPLKRGKPPQAWARVATLAAGPGSGSWFLPAVGDEVLVACEAGDPARPCVLGALWHAQARPPQAVAADGSNHHRQIRTPRGVVIDLVDEPGHVGLTLRTPGGCDVVLDDAGPEVRISDGQGNTVVLDGSGVRIAGAKAVVVEAAKISLAAGLVQVDTGMFKVSGVVQADTLIANTVVAATYTPGAGNLV